ncbi:MAG: MFS transporter [Streptosporangiaceae bacterium]|nr:MFS transporter [Streptosporangiaceae bacterium]
MPHSTLIRNPRFARYWLATTVSGAGTSVSLVAIPLLAMSKLHANDGSVGLLRMAEMLPYLLLSIPVGVIADRVPRRPLLTTADISRFVLIGALPVLYGSHLLSMPVLITVMAGVGCFTVTYDVAQFSLLPALVGDDKLVDANSALESARGGAASLGPSLGGVLVSAFGVVNAVLADACSYLYSGLTFLTMRGVVDSPARQESGDGPHILDGARFVVGTPLLRYLTAYLGVNNFMIQGVLTAALLFFVHILTLPTYAVGLAVGSYGVGFLSGAILARPVGRAVGAGKLLVASSVLGAIGITVVAFAPPSTSSTVFSLLVAMVGMALAGLAGPLFNVHAATLRLQATPPDRLGRVTAAVKLCSQGTVAIGAAVGGLLAATAGPRAALFAFGAASLAATILLLPTPVRRARAREGRMVTMTEPEERDRQDRWTALGIRTDIPHPARVYDYLLGGKDNFAVDREAAEMSLKISPEILDSARANREFLVRAVRFLRDSGIRQFLDIGTGLPTSPNTHEVAQSGHPDARVVYVDNDPVVFLHAESLMADNKTTAVVRADLRDVGEVLTAARKSLDFAEPVGLLFVACLHNIPDSDDPAAIVARYLAALAPGSFLVISHVTDELAPERMHAITAEYAKRGTVFVGRSKEAIRHMFSGAELVDPGIVLNPHWRPDTPKLGHHASRVWGYCGVARA